MRKGEAPIYSICCLTFRSFERLDKSITIFIKDREMCACELCFINFSIPVLIEFHDEGYLIYVGLFFGIRRLTLPSSGLWLCRLCGKDASAKSQYQYRDHGYKDELTQRTCFHFMLLSKINSHITLFSQTIDPYPFCSVSSHAPPSLCKQVPYINYMLLCEIKPVHLMIVRVPICVMIKGGKCKIILFTWLENYIIFTSGVKLPHY